MRSGAILALTDDGVVGWAIDHEKPETHFRVVVLGNGQPLGVGMTAVSDLSLVKVACGENRPSFTISPQSEEALRFPLELELRDTEGTLLGPSLTIEHSDHIDPRTLRLYATAYEGFCERQVDGRLEGWAWNTCIPQLPVILEVSLEGEVHDFVRADRFRHDLVEAGKRNGSCGFSVVVPAQKSENPAYEVALKIAGTGFDLQFLTSMQSIAQVPLRHEAAGEQVHPIEQQLLSMGGGHPNVAQSETPGGSVMQYASERELAFTALEAKIRDALGAQNSRFDRQEAILAAVKGTVDNLVRTWLQVRNDIALLRADFAAVQATMTVMPSDAPGAHKDLFERKASSPAQVTKDNIGHSQSTTSAGLRSSPKPAPHAAAQVTSGVTKPPGRARSTSSIRKRKAGSRRPV